MRGGDLITSGPTKTISEPETDARKEKKEVSFSGSFSDCADTTVRHFLNLLFYCQNEDWSDVLPKEVSAELESAKEAVVAAIKSKDDEHKKVEFKGLKERVQMFYLHQTKSKANDCSEDVRTLWNYVVSNMDKEDFAKSGFYQIRYVEKIINGIKRVNYELDTGFINMLKLIYNIEKALYDGVEQKSDPLKVAHVVIDKLSDTEVSDREDSLKDAIEAIVHVVKPNVKIEDVSFNQKEGDQDIYGALTVTLKISDNVKDNINFTIHQEVGHAWLEITSKQKPLNIDLGGFKEDPIIDFFVKKIFENGNADFYGNYDGFYEKLKSSYDSQDSKCLAKSHMLRLLKETAGERTDNFERLYNCCKSYFSVKSDLSMEQIKLFDLFQNVYRNSTLKHFGLEVTDFKDAEESADGNYKYIKREGGVVEICPTTKLKDAESITIPANIGGCNKYIISKGAFIGFTNLKEVTFADGVESVEIGDFAFSAGNVEKVNIPAGVTALKLGVGVFHDANVCGELNIADGVENIEIGTVKFVDNKLDKIVVSAGVREYTIPAFAFSGLKLPESVSLSGAKVETLSINQFAFQNSEVKNFTMIDGLKKLIIEDDALWNSNLEGIVIPSSVEELRLSDYSKFAVSKSGKLRLNPHIKKLTIGKNVFNVITKDGAATISNNLDELILTADVFDYNTTKLTILRGVKKLEFLENAFQFSSIETLDLQGVKKLDIKSRAFDSSHIKDLNLSSLQELTINDDAFASSEVKNLSLGSAMKKLNMTSGAFNGVGEGFTVNADHCIQTLELLAENMIGDLNLNANSFSGIKAETLKFSDNVKTLTINEDVFVGSEIKKLDLNKVENLTLNSNAFKGFKGEELTIPAGVKSLMLNANTFSGSEIKKLDLNKVENLMLNSNAFKGFRGKEFTVSGKVKELTLNANTFSGSEIETVDLQGVETLTIEGSEFEGGSISKINFDKIKHLKLSAYSFKGLKESELIIPKDIINLELENYIFYESKIKTLVIKSKLEADKIADSAFYSENLKKIIVYDEESGKLLRDNKSKYGISEEVMIELDESKVATKDHKLTKYGYDYVAKLIRESEVTKGSSPINMLRSICYEKKYSDWTVKDCATYFAICFSRNLRGLKDDNGQIEKLEFGFGIKCPDSTDDLSAPQFARIKDDILTAMKYCSADAVEDMDHKLTKCGYDFIADLISSSQATNTASPTYMLHSTYDQKNHSGWTAKDYATYFAICFSRNLRGLKDDNGQIEMLKSRFDIKCPDPTDDLSDSRFDRIKGAVFYAMRHYSNSTE